MLALLTAVLQNVVAGVLLVTAAAKLGSPANRETWGVLLAKLPVRLSAAAMSRAHICAEFAVGALLLLGIGPAVPSLAAATLMLASFTALAGYAAWSGRTIPCSCFGRASTPLGWLHAARNLVLTIMAAAALTGALASPQAEDPSAGVFALSLAASLVVILPMIFQDDIVHLIRSNARSDRGRDSRSI